MKVRFFERAKGLVRLGCTSAAVLMLATAASAATPGWEVQIINIDETIDSTTTAETVLDSNGSGYTVTSNQKKVYPVVDMLGNVAGSLPYNFPYPDGTTGAAGNDFAVRAKANVTIPAGTWTLAFASDDGGKLQLDSAGFAGFDATFNENGGIGGNQIRFEAPRGTSWTGGSFTVANQISGSITADMYERGGGDNFEIAVAQGAQGGFGPNFKALGNGTFGWGVTTTSTAASAGDAIIDIAGGNVGKYQATGTAAATVNTTGTPVNGALTHRYYLSGNAGNFGAADALNKTGLPVAMFNQTNAALSQWWTGSEGAVAGYAPQYHAGLAAATGNPANLENYMGLLTGQLLIPKNGTYQFKDGIDDFTSLRLDINGNGTFDDGEQLINDNNWTSFRGEANGGSPIVSADFSGVPSGGKWVNFEFIAWEGGGGDSGHLMWDYDAATGTVGGNFDFPSGQDQAPTDVTKAGIPNQFFRTYGVKLDVNPELDSIVKYQFDVHSKSFYDQITIPSANGGTVAPLKLNGATLVIKSAGDLLDGETIKIIDGATQGTANFQFPAGTTWDTTKFAATGEITLVDGPNGTGGGGPPFDGDRDGDVDSADLLGFLEAWTGSNAGNLEDAPGRANLVYNPATGEVKLVPAAGSKIVGFTLGNSAGQLKPGSNDEFTGKTPWADVVYDNKATQIGSSDLSFVGATSEFSLGNILPEGLSKEGVQGFLSLARYSAGLGTPQTEFDLVVVPEPASMALLGLGLLGVVNSVRRRRS